MTGTEKSFLFELCNLVAPGIIPDNPENFLREKINKLINGNIRLQKEKEWLAYKAWRKVDADYLPERNHNCWECPFNHDCTKCWLEAAETAVGESEKIMKNSEEKQADPDWESV